MRFNICLNFKWGRGADTKTCGNIRISKVGRRAGRGGVKTARVTWTFSSVWKYFIKFFSMFNSWFLSLKLWPDILATKRRGLLNIESFYIPLRNQYIIKMNSNTPLKIKNKWKKKSSQTFGRCKIENYKIHKTSHLLSTNLIQPHTYIIILINITVWLRYQKHESECIAL